MESLKELKWQTWLHDETKCKKDFDVFLKKNSLKKEDETVHLSKSHTNKMEYNLLFVQHLFDIQKFYDWVIVGCYVKELDRKPRPSGRRLFLEHPKHERSDKPRPFKNFQFLTAIKDFRP